MAVKTNLAAMTIGEKEGYDETYSTLVNSASDNLGVTRDGGGGQLYHVKKTVERTSASMDMFALNSWGHLDSTNTNNYPMSISTGKNGTVVLVNDNYVSGVSYTFKNIFGNVHYLTCNIKANKNLSYTVRTIISSILPANSTDENVIDYSNYLLYPSTFSAIVRKPDSEFYVCIATLNIVNDYTANHTIKLGNQGVIYSSGTENIIVTGIITTGRPVRVHIGDVPQGFTVYIGDTASTTNTKDILLSELDYTLATSVKKKIYVRVVNSDTSKYTFTSWSATNASCTSTTSMSGGYFTLNVDYRNASQTKPIIVSISGGPIEICVYADTGNISMGEAYVREDYTGYDVNTDFIGSSMVKIQKNGRATWFAIPKPGYEFVRWSNTWTSNPTTVSGITSSFILTAYFKQKQTTITVKSSIIGPSTDKVYATVDGQPKDNPSVSVVPGIAIIISAVIEDTNYEFVKWNDGDTNANRTIQTTDFDYEKEYIYTALFRRK